MLSQPSRLLFLFVAAWPAFAFSASGKITASYGYFALDAQASGVSSQIASPSVFHVGYLKPIWDHYELKIGYTILMADLSGSDLGYGLDAGINYFPFTFASDSTYTDQGTSIYAYEEWRPLIGFSFNQRSFQSVRNTYAGFGFNAGVEKHFNQKLNLRLEAKMISLTGAGQSEATETTLLLGAVFKI